MADDEDAFLYGDSPAPAAPALPAAVQAAISGASEPASAYEPPAPTQDDEDGEVEMDEDSSDSDDIEITLDGDPNAAPSGYRPPIPSHLRQPLTIASPGTQSGQSGSQVLAQRATADVALLRPSPDPRQGTPPAPMSSTASGLPRTDVTAPAYVDDGESLLDVDIDDLPDHPWRKAGTVLSDYFNYGFDEATWKVYCARQKSGREEREKERELPFSVFASLPLQEAYEVLSVEQRNALMHTIAAHFALTMGGANGDAATADAASEGHGTPVPAVSPMPPVGRNAGLGAFGVPPTAPSGPRGRAMPMAQPDTGGLATERPPLPVRPVSPLPADIPTGPRNSRPPIPVRPRGHEHREPEPKVVVPPPPETLDYGDDASETTTATNAGAGAGSSSKDGRHRERNDSSQSHRDRDRRSSRSEKDKDRSSRRRERAGSSADEGGEEGEEMAVDGADGQREKRSANRRSKAGKRERERSDRHRDSADRKESSSKRSRKDDDGSTERRSSRVKEEAEDEDDLAEAVERRGSRTEGSSSRSKRSKH